MSNRFKLGIWIISCDSYHMNHIIWRLNNCKITRLSLFESEKSLDRNKNEPSYSFQCSFQIKRNFLVDFNSIETNCILISRGIWNQFIQAASLDFKKKLFYLPHIHVSSDRAALMLIWFLPNQLFVRSKLLKVPLCFMCFCAWLSNSLLIFIF